MILGEGRRERSRSRFTRASGFVRNQIVGHGIYPFIGRDFYSSGLITTGAEKSPKVAPVTVRLLLLTDCGFVFPCVFHDVPLSVSVAGRVGQTRGLSTADGVPTRRGHGLVMSRTLVSQLIARRQHSRSVAVHGVPPLHTAASFQ